MELGATSIFDTDDDNIPIDSFYEHEIVRFAEIVKQKGWCNVYQFFHGSKIWPRGFSLSHINNISKIETFKKISCPIQQGLADGNPDVDAIWRLVMYKNLKFKGKRNIALSSGVWCPFNSQTTWWFPEAFHLMYLPTFATFRMTDIWRSFIAQKCLWAMGKRVLFYSPAEVRQDRNEHNLLHDFEDEVPGYINNEDIIKALDSLKLKKGNTLDNLETCYKMMVDKGFLPGDELQSLRGWIWEVREHENA